MTRPTYHDPHTKCVCQHMLGHHHEYLSTSPIEPKACRVCECEGFITPKELVALNAVGEETS